MINTKIAVVIYLVAIVIANLTTTLFGPNWSVVNAFLFIGLDLTLRDSLHEKWEGRGLFIRMFLLIGFGGFLSAVVNVQASNIALASTLAFVAAGVSDTLVYHLNRQKSRFLRMTNSNIVSAAVDSFVFPVIAFGMPVLWAIVFWQWIAKTAGGLLWAYLLTRNTK